MRADAEVAGQDQHIGRLGVQIRRQQADGVGAGAVAPVQVGGDGEAQAHGGPPSAF